MHRGEEELNTAFEAYDSEVKHHKKEIDNMIEERAGITQQKMERVESSYYHSIFECDSRLRGKEFDGIMR